MARQIAHPYVRVEFLPDDPSMLLERYHRYICYELHKEKNDE